MSSFGRVGLCIYCGATNNGDLSDEHIVPFSLNGTLVLPAASCSRCADVTKGFEQTVARAMYGTLRVEGRFRTRRPRQRPRHGTLSYHDSQYERKSVDISMERFPTAYPVIKLPEPGILTGAVPSDLNPPFEIQIKVDETEAASIQRELNARALETVADLHWGDFCRVLAKIGHAYLVATTGLEGYDATSPSASDRSGRRNT